MKKHFSVWLAVLALLGVVAVGCGSDDKDKSSSGDSSSQSKEKKATPEADKGTKAEKGNDSNLSNPQVKQAVASCKQNIKQAAQLSPSVKKDLKKICEQAASGDEDAVRKASRDVCKKIVQDSVPAGAARETAVKSCDQSTAAP